MRYRDLGWGPIRMFAADRCRRRCTCGGLRVRLDLAGVRVAGLWRREGWGLAACRAVDGRILRGASADRQQRLFGGAVAVSAACRVGGLLPGRVRLTAGDAVRYPGVPGDGPVLVHTDGAVSGGADTQFEPCFAAQAAGVVGFDGSLASLVQVGHVAHASSVSDAKYRPKGNG